jgi:predicted outer membrane protein
MTTHRSRRIDVHGSLARRFGLLLGVLAVLLANAFVVFAAQQAHAAGGDGRLPDGWRQTPFGPLSPTDRDFLIRIRQACLWEIPSGQMAQKQGQSPRVREVGTIILQDHLALDEKVRAVASQLGDALPDKPSVDQQRWLDEQKNARGAAFDSVFANRLRGAHGIVFKLIADVRATTRNDAIRSFAEAGDLVVMKHMSLLESIGTVDYAALPQPAGSALTPAERLARSFGNGRGTVLVWIVLFVAVIACLSAAVRAIRPR